MGQDQIIKKNIEEERIASRMRRRLQREFDSQSLVLQKLYAALVLIATPQRPDGTWNRDREACRQIAEEALKSLKE